MFFDRQDVFVRFVKIVIHEGLFLVCSEYNFSFKNHAILSEFLVDLDKLISRVGILGFALGGKVDSWN
jgi:hypothetical protein